MYRHAKIEAMLLEITANVERKEQSLLEEYKKLIRFSSDFDVISEQFISLEQRSLAPAEKDEEVTNLVDRLCAQLDSTYGSDRDNTFIFEAAMAVMKENTTLASGLQN